MKIKFNNKEEHFKHFKHFGQCFDDFYDNFYDIFEDDDRDSDIDNYIYLPLKDLIESFIKNQITHHLINKYNLPEDEFETSNL